MQLSSQHICLPHHQSHHPAVTCQSHLPSMVVNSWRNWFGLKIRNKWAYHCVTTEKVPAKYRSLKMADASLGKCSIFVDWGGIAWTRQRLSGVCTLIEKCVETFQNTGTVAGRLGKAVWGVRRSGVKRTVPWIACWRVENGTCILRTRYLQIKNGTCSMRTRYLQCAIV